MKSLIVNRFVHSDDMRSKGDKKPTKVEIFRDPKKLRGPKVEKFLVLDSVDNLSAKDWLIKLIGIVLSLYLPPAKTGSSRIGTGKHQSKFFTMVLLLIVLGFSLKFQDDPVQGSLNQWNVTQLKINRTARYLDPMVVHNFWTKLDQFITSEKPHLLNKLNS